MASKKQMAARKAFANAVKNGKGAIAKNAKKKGRAKKK